MRQLIPTLLLLLLFTASAEGQETHFPLEGEVFHGIIQVGMQGLNGTQITNVVPTFIADGFDTDLYNTSDFQNVGFTIGASGYYRFRNEWLSLQFDILYANNKGGYKYDDVNGLEYDLTINYKYINITFGPKVYPACFAGNNNHSALDGLYFRGGVYYSINANKRGQHRLSYCHSPEEIWGPCEYVEEELLKLVKGQNNWGFMGAIGFEVGFYNRNSSDFGVVLEAGYYHGLKDVVDIGAQPYGFRGEIENLIRPIQITLGLAFPIGN